MTHTIPPNIALEVDVSSAECYRATSSYDDMQLMQDPGRAEAQICDFLATLFWLVANLYILEPSSKPQLFSRKIKAFRVRLVVCIEVLYDNIICISEAN